MLRKIFLAAMVIATVATVLIAERIKPALAQTPCDSWSVATATGATGPTEIIPAASGKRIYLCGYVLTAKTNALDFQLVSGTGTNCADNAAPLTPPIALANGGTLVNRMPWTVGEYTPPGYALCAVTTGTGELAGTLYWTQRP